MDQSSSLFNALGAESKRLMSLAISNHTGSLGLFGSPWLSLGLFGSLWLTLVTLVCSLALSGAHQLISFRRRSCVAALYPAFWGSFLPYLPFFPIFADKIGKNQFIPFLMPTSKMCSLSSIPHSFSSFFCLCFAAFNLFAKSIYLISVIGAKNLKMQILRKNHG